MRSTDSEARRYLLGALSADAEARFEDTLLADATIHAEVAAETDELLDDYAAGRLATGDRTALEQRLLATPDGQRRLRAARALARTAAAAQPVAAPRSRSWWRAWMLAPVLGAVAVAVFIIARPGSPAPEGPAVVAIRLAPATRDANVAEVVVGPVTRTVRIAWTLDALVRTAARTVRLAGPAQRQLELAFAEPLDVPAEALAAGLWELTIADATGAPLAVLDLRVR
jgi:hypothetical protein